LATVFQIPSLRQLIRFDISRTSVTLLTAVLATMGLLPESTGMATRTDW
jgi:hypothetical protein